MVRHYSDIDPFLELRSSSKNLAQWQRPTRFPQGRWGLFICLYEAGQSVSWSRIAWDETLPANTDVQFQLAFSNSQSGPWSYIGPDGTAGTYFTTASGETLPATPAFQGRYARFKARLSSSDGLHTPTFGNVHLSFTGAGLLASSCNNFVYDPAGNITSIETVTDAGTTVDDRNPAANPINALNQVLQRDVGGVSWLYSYDLNGNLIGKTNGTDTFIYTWSDENRLERVQGPGGLDVSYTYDTSGRMMTRTSGGVTTRLTWDGFDCVREETVSSVTIYHIPDGMLHSFSLDGVVFQCHSDALGSVRMITDASGVVVARLEYGAWGEEIFVSAIPALQNFPYRFVGVAGVRTDSETGLVYMRARHYDKQLRRFISRDPIGMNGGPNLYAYAWNRPQQTTDAYGLIAPLVAGAAVLGVWLTWQVSCAAYALNYAVEWDVRTKQNKPGCYGNNKDRIQHCIASCLHNKCTGLFQYVITMAGGMTWEGLGGTYSTGDVVADAYGAAKSWDLIHSCEASCTTGYQRGEYGPEPETDMNAPPAPPIVDPHLLKNPVPGMWYNVGPSRPSPHPPGLAPGMWY